MQSINVTAVRPPLMLAMFGTAAVCVAAVVAAVAGDGGGTGWVVAGAALYLAGTVGVTIGGNVPLNDALARVEPGSAGRELWTPTRSAGRLEHTCAASPRSPPPRPSRSRWSE